MTTGPLIELSHVSKTFGATQALSNVDLTIFPGEVHGLLGINGSGKSTLLKVLSGVVEPDTGAELLVRSQVSPLPSSGSYRKFGWGFVHQDLGLFPSMRIVDNFHLSGTLASSDYAISWSKEIEFVTRILDQFNLKFDPRVRVDQLRPSERALLAIARAMYEASMHSQFDDDRYVLFLDESTVSLQEHERREMGERIDRITSAGGAVVLVSHDLTEIHELTQRVTVLRDGRVVGTAMTEELTEEKMLTLVVGSAFTTTRAESRRDSSHRGDPVLTVSGLTGTDLSDISFDCFSGEILGLTGLAGSGFEEVPYDLFGAHPVSGGTLTLDGKVIQLKGLRPNVAIADGICLVPGDRRSQGMALTESVRSNVTLPRLTSYRNRFGWLSKAGEEKDAVATTKRVGVWPADTSHLTAMLSGGNQQKALLAKWLNANPRVLILHEPTIGIDVPTRVKLQNLLREAADEGMCIICASGDFEQLEILCDRVIIFRDGKITAELAGSQLTKNNIALESLGATNE